MEIDNEDNCDRKKYIYEEFKHFSEVTQLIDNANNDYKDINSKELAEERFKVICDSYQEQPHLLDPYLERILQQCLRYVRDSSTPVEMLHVVFRYLFLLVKTRGYKSVIRLMPHEVADLEPTLKLLSEQDPKDPDSWETCYVLLLWLSIVCMIPFDLCRLDVPGREPVLNRVIDIGKVFLNHCGKPQDASAYLLAKFLSRPDVVKAKLGEFINWCCEKIPKFSSESTAEMIHLHGILRCLAHLFKFGKRQDLLPYAEIMIETLQSSCVSNTSHVQVKKFHAKLLQRIGLVFLPMRVASWRYQRGNRSLLANLAPKNQDASSTGDRGKMALNGEDDDDFDVPDEVATIIDHLLRSLKDRDTVVRWSAAKGIGRLCSRLPHELVDGDVLSEDALLSLFSRLEGHASWHGGCLALAELARRGLLLPSRLPDVLAFLLEALVYEEKAGDCTLGSNVRDAACYVCWAFARAYDPQEMSEHVVSVASSLVLVSLFDREVNVRRAAAAAFQENVGRQGHFPHGIDILTHLDYFAVGNRSLCYTEHSEFVAQFPEYIRPMIDHLVENKLGHWDAVMRELAAKALNHLTKYDREYMLKTALPRMLSMCVGTDLYRRNGSILAVAEVLLALNNASELSQEIRDQIKDITLQLTAKQMFRGLTGELMRRACCNLIDRCSRVHMPFHKEMDLLRNWCSLLEEGLQHREVLVQDSAVIALPSYLTAYFNFDVERARSNEEFVDDMLSRFTASMQSAITENVRSGICRAIGALPLFVISQASRMALLTGALVHATELEPRSSKWADSRRQALLALVSVLRKAMEEKVEVDLWICCSEAMLRSLQDYSVDSRGDVGAIVRESAMNCLVDVCQMLMSHAKSEVVSVVLTADRVERLIGGIIQQAVEKIDRTRGVAGNAFARLIHSDSRLDHIPHQRQLLSIFPKGVCEKTSWTNPMETFPLFCSLLPLEKYQLSLLTGLTVSVGGLTESTVRHSSEAIQNALIVIEEEGSEAMDRVVTNLIGLYESNKKNDRITIPMMKFLDFLLNNTSLCDHMVNMSLETKLKFMDLTKAEVVRSADIHKLMAAIGVYCTMVQFLDARKKALSSLMVLLCHRYPVIRKSCATRIYESVLTYDAVLDDESMDEAMSLLTETVWEEDVNTIRPIRNSLCNLFKVPIPTLRNVSKSSAASTSNPN